MLSKKACDAVITGNRRNLALKLLKKPWLILACVGIVVAVVLIVRWVT